MPATSHPEGTQGAQQDAEPLTEDRDARSGCSRLRSRRAEMSAVNSATSSLPRLSSNDSHLTCCSDSLFGDLSPPRSPLSSQSNVTLHADASLRTVSLSGPCVPVPFSKRLTVGCGTPAPRANADCDLNPALRIAVSRRDANWICALNLAFPDFYPPCTTQ